MRQIRPVSPVLCRGLGSRSMARADTTPSNDGLSGCFQHQLRRFFLPTAEVRARLPAVNPHPRPPRFAAFGSRALPNRARLLGTVPRPACGWARTQRGPSARGKTNGRNAAAPSEGAGKMTENFSTDRPSRTPRLRVALASTEGTVRSPLRKPPEDPSGYRAASEHGFPRAGAHRVAINGRLPGDCLFPREPSPEGLLKGKPPEGVNPDRLAETAARGAARSPGAGGTQP